MILYLVNYSHELISSEKSGYELKEYTLVTNLALCHIILWKRLQVLQSEYLHSYFIAHWLDNLGLVTENLCASVS